MKKFSSTGSLFILLFIVFTIHYPLTTNHCLYAAGLSSPNASMYLGNLKIGQTYSLRQLLGYPFKATYKGRSMADLSISVIALSTATSDGYEPIPSNDWIEIERSHFSLDPGQTAETDILIKIPDDTAHLDKKYIVIIQPQSGAPRASGAGIVFGTALRCQLRLDIAALPPTPDEIRQLRRLRHGQSVGVVVSPERIFVNEIEAGKKIDVKKTFGDVIKIVNSSDFDVEAVIESADPAKFGMFAPSGYETAPDHKWLVPAKRKIKIQKNRIAEAPVTINIPSGPEHEGKSYYFAIAVTVKSPIREVNHLVRFFVDMK